MSEHLCHSQPLVRQASAQPCMQMKGGGGDNLTFTLPPTSHRCPSAWDTWLEALTSVLNLTGRNLPWEWYYDAVCPSLAGSTCTRRRPPLPSGRA